jgi:hypothetical protein
MARVRLLRRTQHSLTGGIAGCTVCVCVCLFFCIPKGAIAKFLQGVF